jgi:hypothetical protein
MGFENSCKRIIRPQPPRGAGAARSTTVAGSKYSLQRIKYGTIDFMSTFLTDLLFGLDELHGFWHFWHFLIFFSIRLTDVGTNWTAAGCICKMAKNHFTVFTVLAL